MDPAVNPRVAITIRKMLLHHDNPVSEKKRHCRKHWIIML
jgi:hypothetical protein